MGVFGVFFGCRGVVGFKVATSLRPVCEVFRPAWLGVCVSAKKFAQRAENTPKLVFLGLLGEFCCGLNRGEGLRWASIFAHTGTAAWYQRDVVPYMRERVLARASRIVRDERGALHAGKGGVFALHEAFQGRVVGVSEPHVVQFPRLVGECEGCCAQSADHLGEKR